MQVYYDKDCDIEIIKAKKVAIIGYGSQGHAHACNLQESGVDVTVGLRPGSSSRAKAESHGLKVADVPEAVAAAELQRIIKDIVVENGAQIVSTQILPTSQKQAQQEVFLPVSLKVRLRGTLADVVDTLYDIETGETFLFLDNVIMRDSTGGRSTRAKSNTKLDVNFDLTAYMPITS